MISNYGDSEFLREKPDEEVYVLNGVIHIKTVAPLNFHRICHIVPDEKGGYKVIKVQVWESFDEF